MITAIVYIIVGAIMLLVPGHVSDIVCYLISGTILVFSANQVMKFLRTKQNFTLVLAILAGMLGLYILFNPKSFASLIPTVVGVLFIVDSISKLLNSLELKKVGFKGYQGILISSLLILAFGLFLVFNPFGAVEIVIILIGLVLIANGVLELITFKAKSKNDSIIEAEIITKKR